MRKLIGLVALAALVGGPAALAKERNLSMIGAPVAGSSVPATRPTGTLER